MDEKSSKGISLRKKRSVRPPISAPKQISSPSPAQALPSRPAPVSKPVPGEIPWARPQGGGKTSDFVKRRYSTRYNQLPADFDATKPPLPAVPGAGGDLGSGKPPSPSGGRGPSPGTRPGPKVDMNILRDASLQPEKYAAQILSDASDQEIRDYESGLKKMRNRTSTDLQQNVYQNRTQFIKISREAEELKGEMNTLGGLINELKTTVESLIQTSSNNSLTGSDTQASSYEAMPAAARKQANRSSVANLEAMWNTQLQALWKNVEGSQKFLPANAGRHVVRDSPRWVELNSATWKPKRHIHMFLLNDHLLVASRKEKRAEGHVTDGSKQKHQNMPSKLVAERCFPLQDIEMVDLASSDSAPVSIKGMKREKEHLANAITVRAGQESFTYRSDKSDGTEKQNLLLAFRKAADELRKILRAETVESGKATESKNYLSSREPGLAEKPNLLEGLADNASKDRRNIMIDVDGKQQSLQWVDNQIDELDIDIALQRCEESVARIERLKKLARSLKSNRIAQDLITFKTDERAGRVADLLTRNLIETHSSLTAAKRNVGWLVRLGFEDRAREVFLDTRTDVIKKRTRQCIFEGNFEKYVWQISYICFTIIRNTINTYQACFPPVMMSACVKWAKEHVDEFVHIYQRQMEGVDEGGALRQACTAVVRDNGVLLKEAGLDFRNLAEITTDDEGVSAVKRKQGPVGLGLR